MNSKVIEKGYHIEVTTWENDGDNYKTESVVVETLEEATNVANSCVEFHKKYGNEEVVCYDEEECDYFNQPYLEDLIGTWCEWEYYRNVSSIRIYQIPETMTLLNLWDGKFK